MFSLRQANESDRLFWQSLVPHISEKRFEQLLKAGQSYTLFDDETPVGVLEGSFLWENLPFLSLLFIREEHRGKGFGKLAMQHWESALKRQGFQMALTSTQSDESAQHFYRKLGYKDCGCLVINEGPLAQPAELYLSKVL